VRENRTPGSVRGASGNRRPYRDDAHIRTDDDHEAMLRYWSRRRKVSPKG
jgi:hypothetical protein